MAFPSPKAISSPGSMRPRFKREGSGGEKNGGVGAGPFRPAGVSSLYISKARKTMSSFAARKRLCWGARRILDQGVSRRFAKSSITSAQRSDEGISTIKKASGGVSTSLGRSAVHEKEELRSQGGERG